MYETMKGSRQGLRFDHGDLPIDPGQKQKAVLKVSAEYPLVSGAIMLGMTNDGFLGLEQSIDMFKIDKPTVFDLLCVRCGHGAEHPRRRGVPGGSWSRSPGRACAHPRPSGQSAATPTLRRWGWDVTKPVAE